MSYVNKIQYKFIPPDEKKYGWSNEIDGAVEKKSFFVEEKKNSNW